MKKNNRSTKGKYKYRKMQSLEKQRDEIHEQKQETINKVHNEYVKGGTLDE